MTLKVVNYLNIGYNSVINSKNPNMTNKKIIQNSIREIKKNIKKMIPYLGTWFSEKYQLAKQK